MYIKSIINGNIGRVLIGSKKRAVIQSYVVKHTRYETCIFWGLCNANSYQRRNITRSERPTINVSAIGNDCRRNKRRINVSRSSRIRLSLTKATIDFVLLHFTEPIKHCSHRSPGTVTREHCIWYCVFASTVNCKFCLINYACKFRPKIVLL